jgi:hypothetical protein
MDKDIDYLVEEFETIFQPFAYDGSSEKLAKLLLDYKDFIIESIIKDIKLGVYISKVDYCLHEAIEVNAGLYYKNKLISSSKSTTCL